ncbi:MAG TPA: hypothetical protein VIV40_05040 [Kofleriaceae bacterium]
MLLFRSLAIGLLAAAVALLALGVPIELRITQRIQQPLALSHQASTLDDRPVLPTIIDVAPGISLAQLASTIRLAPDEQIIAVDDVAVTNDLSAGLLLASRDLHARQFIDFTVWGPDGERRVLALLH